jgi:hypothetical protein
MAEAASYRLWWGEQGKVWHLSVTHTPGSVPYDHELDGVLSAGYPEGAIDAAETLLRSPKGRLTWVEDGDDWIASEADAAFEGPPPPALFVGEWKPFPGEVVSHG